MGNILIVHDRLEYWGFNNSSIQPNEAIMDLTKITPISTEPFEFGPIQTKWLEALEGGEYLQGAGTLKSQEPIEDGKHTYCCLGVLCEIQGILWEVSKTGEFVNGFIFPGVGKHLNYPTAIFAESVGLRSVAGMLQSPVPIDMWTFQNLAAMNDSIKPKLSFKDIAAYIRHDPHNVFMLSA